jgi:hypothetical protein
MTVMPFRLPSAWYLFPWLACMVAPWSHAAERIVVTALEPVPNYASTRDEHDAVQLVDGQYSSFPAWTNRDSVGWVNQSPVAVTLKAATREGASYALVLRTARQSHAGVAPPRRVDVYCGTRFSSAWRHVGEREHAAVDSADRAPLDLTVPLTGCGGTSLQVVIHADGAFVMLDELSLKLPLAKVSSAIERNSGSAPVMRIDKPVLDSTQRLEAGLRTQAEAILARAVAALPGDGSYAGLVSAWGALDRPAVAARLAVKALPDAPVHYVISLVNASRQPRNYHLISEAAGVGDVAISTQATVQRLESVLGADGRLAFDVPVATEGPLRLKPGGLAFVLITEPRGAVSGQRRWRIGDDAGWMQRLTVDVTIYEGIHPVPADRPRVLTWSYTHDIPIWSAANAVGNLDRLSGDGVNVYVIHPRDMPQPFAEADWPMRTAALREALALYRGRGLMLLFLGAEGWQALSSMSDDAPTRRALARWVALLTTTVREAGYAADEWALYPVDEPHGADLGRLADAIDVLRAIEPQLRFYANVTASHSLTSLTSFQLRALQGRIDYWQPRAGEVYDRVSALLDGRVRNAGATPELWLYANPPAPARSALPSCYRDLGRFAHDAGATGLGFWSLSDTGKSSAWSDFDGQRPDWAVVYEAKGDVAQPFIAGRRWLAVVAGIADHAALRFCARPAAIDVVNQCKAYRAALDAARPDCAGWW